MPQLCADGYDVSNLVSEDPALRRRGFKLEYFLRPPVQVTLAFRWQVEVCGVDVELWPAGMDQNAVSRKLEIHSSSEADADGTQDLFLQVGRCEVREGVLVCFRAPRFRPRAPLPRLPPAPSSGAVQSELWSRGLQSLGTVARLRLSIPFSSAGTQLGLKALAVWGLPTRSCPPEALEEFQRAHRRTLAAPHPKPLLFSKPSSPDPSSRPSELPGVAGPDQSIPEEFLDPLTQELMVLPMVLPSGAVVDLSSLEEYQRREATWGRLPNDPFTGVPFSADSKPLPCPLLKSRIDQLLLRRGGRPGICGAKEGAALLGPQTSRLVPQSPSLAQTPTPPQGLRHKAPNRPLSSHHKSASWAPSNGTADNHPSSSRSSSPHSKQGGGEQGRGEGGQGCSSSLRRKRGAQAPIPDEDEDAHTGHTEANSRSTPAEGALQPCKRTRVEQQTHPAGEALVSYPVCWSLCAPIDMRCQR